MGDYRRDAVPASGTGNTAHRPARSRRIARALGIAALALGAAAPAAGATPVSMSFTDPVDQVDPGVDLVSGTFEQDTITGTIKTHLEFAGTPATGTSTLVRVEPGNSAPDGTCARIPANAITVVARRDIDDVRWVVGSWMDWAPGTGTRSDTTLDLEIKDNALQRTVATCAVIGAGTSLWPNEKFDALDEVMPKAELAPTRVGGQVAGGTNVDTDKDGLTDVVDSCPRDPGPKPSGCPAGTAKSLRLGARRLVVDRLMSLTGTATACPAVVKVIVMQGRKRLGAAKLPVTTVTGEPIRCEVKGVTRLKRRSKRVAVRVTMSGLGLAAETQQIDA